MRQRDKSDLPLPVLSYKYFLLEYSFSTLSFYSPKLTFPAAAPPKVSKISNEDPSSPTPKSSIVFLARKWPSTSLFLRSVHHFSPAFHCIPILPQFILLNILFLSFVLLFIPKNF